MSYANFSLLLAYNYSDTRCGERLREGTDLAGNGVLLRIYMRLDSIWVHEYEIRKHLNT